MCVWCVCVVLGGCRGLWECHVETLLTLLRVQEAKERPRASKQDMRFSWGLTHSRKSPVAGAGQENRNGLQIACRLYSIFT